MRYRKDIDLSSNDVWLSPTPESSPDGRYTYNIRTLLSYYIYLLYFIYIWHCLILMIHFMRQIHLRTHFLQMRKCPHNWTNYSNIRDSHYTLTMKLIMNIKGHLMLFSRTCAFPRKLVECNNWTSVLNAIKATSVGHYSIHIY